MQLYMPVIVNVLFSPPSVKSDTTHTVLIIIDMFFNFFFPNNCKSWT